MSEQQQQPTSEYEKLYQQQQPPQKPQEGWVAELTGGDVARAQKMLEEQMRQAIQPQLEQAILPRAAEIARAELEVKSYLEKLKSEMPEIQPLEPYILMAVERQMADKAASLKTVAEYVEAYKTTLKEESQKAREAVQQTRAAGKQEALQVKQEVLSSSTSTQVSGEADKGAITPPQEPKPLTPDEYFRERMTRYQRVRGIWV